MTAIAAGSAGEVGDASVLEADAVVAALGADIENGLGAQESARRLALNGPNELRAAPRAPAGGACWRSFRTR